MKTRILPALMMVFMSLACYAQSKQVKIIFDITSKDTVAQQTAVRHAAGMVKSYPNVEVEVVIYGAALPMAMKGKSTVTGALEALKNNPRVSFQVCESAMKKHNVSKDQLLTTMMTVPDAIMEIAVKQAEGWAYIKEVQY